MGPFRVCAKMIHSFAGPDCPMAQQSANDSSAFAAETVLGQEIHQNAVIVAGVQRDVASGFGYGSHNIDGLIAIERRHLDRDHILDVYELAPECVRENAPADTRLEIETEYRKDLCDRADMSDQIAH